MAIKPTPKEGDPTPAAGDWGSYNPPYTPGQYGPNPLAPNAGDPAAAARWKPPIVSPFHYPQGLLDQIAGSQQPMQHGGMQFPRYNFGGQQSQNYVPQGGLLGQIMQMMQKGISRG